MFFINELKRIISQEIVIVFFVISYFLIFRISKNLKRKNFFRDYKITRAVGILYALLAVGSLIILNK